MPKRNMALQSERDCPFPPLSGSGSPLTQQNPASDVPVATPSPQPQMPVTYADATRLGRRTPTPEPARSLAESEVDILKQWQEELTSPRTENGDIQSEPSDVVSTTKC